MEKTIKKIYNTIFTILLISILFLSAGYIQIIYTSKINYLIYLLLCLLWGISLRFLVDIEIKRKNV